MNLGESKQQFCKNKTQSVYNQNYI